MPSVASITIFPIKALDGISVERAELTGSGALALDRRFALVDAEGRYLNGKRTPKVHPIRADFRDRSGQPIVEARGDCALVAALRHESGAPAPIEADLGDPAGRTRLEAWMSEALDAHARLIEDAEAGFPDDTEAGGPTILSAATIAEVAGWYGLGVEETTRRFRANIVVAGTEPFWEDRLFGPTGAERVRFRIGEAAFFFGNNSSKRCVVPSRHPQTGEPIGGFNKEFVIRRKETLPDFSPRDRFDHFFRLATNTLPDGDQSGRLIARDDSIA